MRWNPLRSFRDPSVPKLDNLRRARAAGLRVPETVWLAGADIARAAERGPPEEIGFPLIVRSGSPTEDTKETSNAGQLLSLPVREASGFVAALDRVVAALPRDDRGEPRGAVFVQPLVSAAEAGVAFFDGFWFERTLARGSNEALTSGEARGDVVRGHLARGDAWSAWLTAIHAVFAADSSRIDVEFARDDAGFVLLQVRPALFALTKNETLSLANHKEILGDPPSPWIASVLVDAGREVLAFWSEVDARVAAWGDAYAVPLAERAWMNFSFFFRLMDTWGLPRAMVTQGVGGAGDPADRGVLFGRMIRNAHRLVALQLRSVLAIVRAPAALAALDRAIDEATSLEGLYRACVAAMVTAIRTNFAIGGVFSGVFAVRRFLGVRGAARVVTQEMMERYGALRAIRDRAAREAALDAWLAEFGHRGPLESDPMRPRFAELRDVLLADLESDTSPAGEPAPRVRPRPWGRPFFWIDERREWFRDQLMRRWQRLRALALAQGEALVAADRLDAASDVFSLHGEDLAGDLRAAVIAAKTRLERARAYHLPLTAPRDAIERAITSAEQKLAEAEGRRVFPGIALGPTVVEGRAVKADDLTALLVAAAKDKILGPDAILVVPALEPSWAVVFPRVGGVVAEIGGELSHASILLREARRPAIVNCEGIFRAVRTGDRLRLDGGRGLVEIV
jgi:pyruvate,water dikinase